MSSNKEELAVKAKRHDVDAFNSLYGILFKLAMQKAMRLARGNEADAEELVSDAMSRLPIFLDKWVPSKSTFATFFETCAKNAMINSIKKLKEKHTVSLDNIEELVATEVPEEFNLSDLIGESTTGDIAVNAIKSLSPSQREIVELVIQGKTIKDIAYQLETDESDIKARLKAIVNYISFELRVNDPEGLDSAERKASRN